MISFLLFLLVNTAQAQVHVGGYNNYQGNYVQPYIRTAPDNSIYNNNSYRAPDINLRPEIRQPTIQFREYHNND